MKCPYGSSPDETLANLAGVADDSELAEILDDDGRTKPEPVDIQWVKEHVAGA